MKFAAHVGGRGRRRAPSRAALGVLLGILFVAVLGLGASACPYCGQPDWRTIGTETAVTRQGTVWATQPSWRSAGVWVHQGDILSISALGSVAYSYCYGCGNSRWTGPSGAGGVAYGSDYLAPGRQKLALVGAIRGSDGVWTTFDVGISRLLFAPASGTLYFAMNDSVYHGAFSDNYGSWTVTFTHYSK